MTTSNLAAFSISVNHNNQTGKVRNGAEHLPGGWYPRRRGILEHCKNGTIGALELAIHDVLCHTADHRTGLTRSSAKKIQQLLWRDLNTPAGLRAIQRSLEYLEQIGWIRRWTTPGKHGDYPVLIARFYVQRVPELLQNGAKSGELMSLKNAKTRELMSLKMSQSLSLSWWSVNIERTTDYNDIQYDPVTEVVTEFGEHVSLKTAKSGELMTPSQDSKTLSLKIERKERGGEEASLRSPAPPVSLALKKIQKRNQEFELRIQRQLRDDLSQAYPDFVATRKRYQLEADGLGIPFSEFSKMYEQAAAKANVSEREIEAYLVEKLSIFVENCLYDEPIDSPPWIGVLELRCFACVLVERQGLSWNTEEEVWEPLLDRVFKALEKKYAAYLKAPDPTGQWVYEITARPPLGDRVPNPEWHNERTNILAEAHGFQFVPRDDGDFDIVRGAKMARCSLLAS